MEALAPEETEYKLVDHGRPQHHLLLSVGVGLPLPTPSCALLGDACSV